jgi:hypothetical protein
MKIENEHNGIKFGDKCWAWDIVENAGEEITFAAHLPGVEFPIKVVSDNGNGDEFKFARPLKTEAQKVLEAFKGQKICLKNSLDEDVYYEPKMVCLKHNLGCIREDGSSENVNILSFEDWQLWEAPKVTLDTRRVAGMWCACPHMTDKARLVECVDIQKGLNLRLTSSNDLDGSDLKDGYVFSKDPMKPLDQWQTLEEICREPQA